MFWVATYIIVIVFLAAMYKADIACIDEQVKDGIVIRMMLLVTCLFLALIF